MLRNLKDGQQNEKIDGMIDKRKRQRNWMDE